MSQSFDSYSAFWHFYLRQHARPWTRRLHIGGILAALLFLIAAIVFSYPWLLLPALLAGYGPAWIAHGFIERNRPGTWNYPTWSFVGDIHMTIAWLTGNLARELQRAGIRPPDDSSPGRP
jgi:hypothetical protein